MGIDAVNRAFSTALPAHDFDTIGGLLGTSTGVPQRGETVRSRRPVLHGDDDARRRGALVPLRTCAGRAHRQHRRRRRTPLGTAPPGPWRPVAPAQLLLAGAGALQTLAFVHSAAVVAADAGAGLLAWRLDRAWPARHAATLGWCSAWLAGRHIWWLFISMHRYGHRRSGWRRGGGGAGRRCGAVPGAGHARTGAGGAVAGPPAPLFAALWLLAELARGAG